MKKLQKSGEDVLEAIYNILQNEDHAHSVEIAKNLDISKPSVFGALQNLIEIGYVIKERYGAVTLTPSGTKYAQFVLKKHKAIRKLLIEVLKVSPQTAEIDACKVEHCISGETAEKLFAFLNID